MHGLKTPISQVVTALRLRGEELGPRATARILGTHKNTIAEWERRFAGMKPTLMFYGLCHAFIPLTFEEDEIDTGVGQRVDPVESTGWTAIILERASRFLVEQQCGRKDATLFKKVMRSDASHVQRTQNTTFLSDGERRHSHALFELYAQTVRTGKRGRPRARPCQKAVGYASKTKAVNGIGAVPSARNIKHPNPNIPTPREAFPMRPGAAPPPPGYRRG
ncbi:MAG: hypothetical protein WBQ37_07120 [Candidatus Competibacter sp.]